jgi:hypothetical protein
MSDPNDSTSTGDGVSRSSTFLEFCAKVRKDDPSVLPEPDQPLRIRNFSEKEEWNSLMLSWKTSVSRT